MDNAHLTDFTDTDQASSSHRAGRILCESQNKRTALMPDDRLPCLCTYSCYHCNLLPSHQLAPWRAEAVVPQIGLEHKSSVSSEDRIGFRTVALGKAQDIDREAWVSSHTPAVWCWGLSGAAGGCPPVKDMQHI